MQFSSGQSGGSMQLPLGQPGGSMHFPSVQSAGSANLPSSQSSRRGSFTAAPGSFTAAPPSQGSSMTFAQGGSSMSGHRALGDSIRDRSRAGHPGPSRSPSRSPSPNPSARYEGIGNDIPQSPAPSHRVLRPAAASPQVAIQMASEFLDRATPRDTSNLPSPPSKPVQVMAPKPQAVPASPVQSQRSLLSHPANGGNISSRMSPPGTFIQVDNRQSSSLSAEVVSVAKLSNGNDRNFDRTESFARKTMRDRSVDSDQTVPPIHNIFNRDARSSTAPEAPRHTMMQASSARQEIAAPSPSPPTRGRQPDLPLLAAQTVPSSSSDQRAAQNEATLLWDAECLSDSQLAFELTKNSKQEAQMSGGQMEQVPKNSYLWSQPVMVNPPPMNEGVSPAVLNEKLLSLRASQMGYPPGAARTRTFSPTSGRLSSSSSATAPPPSAGPWGGEDEQLNNSYKLDEVPLVIHHQSYQDPHNQDYGPGRVNALGEERSPSSPTLKMLQANNDLRSELAELRRKLVEKQMQEPRGRQLR